MTEEKYILKKVNRKKNTVQYFKRFKGNKPVWTENEKEAIDFKEMDALRMQRRLETQYKPYQSVFMLEK